MEKEELVKILVNGLKVGIEGLYSWLSTDGEVLGYILGVIHVMLVISLAFGGIYCHTIFPNIWFKLFVFAWMFATWFQHVFLRVCILTLAEEQFAKYAPSNTLILYVIKKVLNIDIPDILTIFVLCETIVVSCFGLELISHLSVYIYSLYDIQL